MRQNNDCSLFSFILTQLLLLDMNYENIFVLSDSIIVTALAAGTGKSFFDKKCAETSFFYVKTVKNP